MKLDYVKACLYYLLLIVIEGFFYFLNSQLYLIWLIDNFISGAICRFQRIGREYGVGRKRRRLPKHLQWHFTLPVIEHDSSSIRHFTDAPLNFSFSMLYNIPCNSHLR